MQKRTLPICGALCVFMTGGLCATAVAQTPVDLNTWSQQGQPSQSTWNVAADGASVLQTVNGGVGLFVSPGTFYNTTVQGSFGVESSSDDDFIGFVFGYQAPIDQTTTAGQTTVDFLLLDWKQSAQSGASPGFRLSHVQGTHKGTSSDVTHELWTHQSSAALTVTPLGTETGTGLGWQDPVGGSPVVYDFTLLYTADQIRIDIAGGQFGSTAQTIFDVAFADLDPATQAVFDDSAFPDGRFGFYNYSQQSVRYQSFTLTEPVLNTAPDDGGTLNFLARVGESDVQSISVTNGGGEGSLLTGNATSPAGAPFQGPAEVADFGLGSGASTDFTYTFSPTARGIFPDAVSIQANAGMHVIDLSGSGVGPVFRSGIAPNSTIDLGEVPPQTTTGQILAIANVTPDDNGGLSELTDLTLDLTITGDAAAWFAVDLVGGTTIGKADDLDIVITFLGGDTLGVYTATLTLLTDENAALGATAAGEQYTFNLSATVVPEPMAGWPGALLGSALLRRWRIRRRPA